MKYAIVEGQRREALRGRAGTCPVCLASLTPRCGKLRVPHWAHQPGSFDHRWEPETEWHRTWKSLFPERCQEVVHHSTTGERHIADVRTDHGHVLELQNSPISEDERRSREAFYRPMCWVVNGLRLKGDRRQFYAAIRLGQLVSPNPGTFLLPTAGCTLLRKWEGSQVDVFFDFGDKKEDDDAVHFGAPVLWATRPGEAKGHAIVMPVVRARFVEAMISGKPLIGINFGITTPTPPPRRPSIPFPPHPWTPGPPRSQRFGARRRGGWRL